MNFNFYCINSFVVGGGSGGGGGGGGGVYVFVV